MIGMWYNNNPNCGRCGHLNHMGFCNLTACLFPVTETIPSNRVVTSEPTPVRDTMVGGLPDANKLGTWQEGIVKEYKPPRTNADRIRSMTDVELADYFSELFCWPNANREACRGVTNCMDCWLDWLREEAEK